MFDRGDFESRGSGLDDEAGDALAAELAVERCGDYHGPGVAAGRDETLAAVDDVAFFSLLRGSLDTGGIGPGVGFGQAERAEIVAPGQARDVLLFLFRSAELVDGVGAERGVGGEGQAGRGADPRYFLDRNRVRLVVEAHTAKFLRPQDAEPAALGHGLDVIIHERAGQVVYGGARLDDIAAERTRLSAEPQVLLRKYHGSFHSVSVIPSPSRDLSGWP